MAAGGSLRVARSSGYYGQGGVDYANRALLAERFGKVPPGKRLRVSWVSGSELEIDLVDDPDRPERPALVPVAVPDRVGRYHVAAARFRRLIDHHEVSRASLVRSTRIVHAIALEAERRRWAVRSPRRSSGSVRIDASGERFWLRLREEGVHARGPWEEEVKRYGHLASSSLTLRVRSTGVPTGSYDANATGRLRLELHARDRATYAGRRWRWADGQRWTLEERLPYLFREIEERIPLARFSRRQARIEAQEAAEEARRRAEERRRQWPILMEEARARLLEADRATHLETRSEAWDQAERLRRYCDALEARHGNDREAIEWLTWVRAYLGRVDPLAVPPTMPDPPDMSPWEAPEVSSSGLERVWARLVESSRLENDRFMAPGWDHLFMLKRLCL